MEREQPKKRKEIVLGRDFDGSYSTLPAYVEVEEGVQVHPSRVEEYLERRKRAGLTDHAGSVS